MKPATDIFISSQQMVASIVVLPLMYGDQNLGGLYFTLETPSNFQNIKDMLMGFVNSIVLVLLQKLEGRLHHMWDAVVQVSVESYITYILERRHVCVGGGGRWGM
jgi:hypothetical protein